MKNRLLMARLDLVYMMALEDMTKLNEKYEDYNKQFAAIRELTKEAGKKELTAEVNGYVGTFRDGLEAYALQGGKLAEMLMAAHKANDKEALSEDLKRVVCQFEYA
jgi:hypothetical protein